MNSSNLTNRIEYKYYVPLQMQAFLIDDLNRFMHIDKHAGENGDYSVSSLYYDNLSLKSYHDKIEGQPKRVKFRLRYYSSSIGNLDEIKIEFKYKIFNQYLKSIQFIDYNLFLKLCSLDFSGIESEKFSPELRRFIEIIKVNNLKPFIRVDYSRRAMISNFDNQVRLTLDNNIRCSRFFGDLDTQPHIPVLSQRVGVLEIKTPSYFPFWLLTIIKKYSLVRSPVSKYALSVQNLAVNSSLIL